MDTTGFLFLRSHVTHVWWLASMALTILALARCEQAYHITLSSINVKTPTKFYVPKRFYRHFYIVGLATAGALLCHFSISLCMWLFIFHMLKRLFEEIFIFRRSSTSKMHVLAYGFGLLYYIFSTLTVASLKTRSHYATPITAFVILSDLLQLCAHWQLRQWQLAQVGKTWSKPKIGLFNFIGSPHYLFEFTFYFFLALLAFGTDTSSYIAMLLMLSYVGLAMLHLSNLANKACEKFN